MSDSTTYSVLPEDEQQTTPVFSPNQMTELYKLLHGFDEPKWKKKKKKKDKNRGKSKSKKKNRAKKLDKALTDLFDSNKKSKKKSNKKSKSKTKKSKGKKQTKHELKDQIILMTAEKSLDTASYGAKRYFDHKWSDTSAK